MEEDLRGEYEAAKTEVNEKKKALKPDSDSCITSAEKGGSKSTKSKQKGKLTKGRRPTVGGQGHLAKVSVKVKSSHHLPVSICA